ncbi:hypothetical protein [Mycolicibacterium sp. NCC-Tsukiji]|uniref:hypothetical protein n=1 Tax=Mycolicibacterium sp. NCC-Tsukiji TaxID=2185272 RepID=UPI000ED1D10C|nr:hypothetical protein [Mycolicibacterium sp. NCC-Tsukiji]GCB01880.1 hypothetical protein NCCNTM_55140 [Mycolicibacterium sp. NCC-Tsukiji]
MSATSAPSALTRTRIELWDTAHLDTAATQWTAAAAELEGAFDQHVSNIRQPAGTVWEGTAADSALDRAVNDQAVVRAQAALLRDLAQIATNGSGDIRAAQRTTLNAIEEAETAGFAVSDALIAADPTVRSAVINLDRQVEANRHSEYIRWHASQLAQSDALVARRLETKAAELAALRFTDHGDGDVTPLAGPLPTSMHPCDSLYASMVGDCASVGGKRARANCYAVAAQVYADCLTA